MPTAPPRQTPLARSSVGELLGTEVTLGPNAILRVRDSDERPLIAVLGGAKVADKLEDDQLDRCRGLIDTDRIEPPTDLLAAAAEHGVVAHHSQWSCSFRWFCSAASG